MKITQEQRAWLYEQAFTIYPYGSIVYGTYQEGISDTDFIVVVPPYLNHLDQQQWEYHNEQYTLYSISTWREKLNRHDIDALECHFLPKNMVIKETIDFDFTLKTALLRQSISSVASNSWVKCKKKLTVHEDFAPRVGKKSLWHALRILNFGIQLMTFKSIVDYGSMNELYDEIVNNPSDNWLFFKEKYQPIYNNSKSAFKLAHAANADTREELL